MNRRSFNQCLTTGTVSLVAASVLSQVSCGGKSVSGVVTIIVGATSELKPLFPSQASVLTKIETLAKDFDTAWTAGKFDSAQTIFANLDSLITQTVIDLGVNGTAKVKLLLATLAIALRTIAALIADAGAANPKAATRATIAAPHAVDRVKSLANPKDADWILKQVVK